MTSKLTLHFSEERAGELELILDKFLEQFGGEYDLRETTSNNEFSAIRFVVKIGDEHTFVELFTSGSLVLNGDMTLTKKLRPALKSFLESYPKRNSLFEELE